MRGNHFTIRKGTAKAADSYLALVQKFPLRPIRSKAELNAATEILDRLFGRDNADRGEADYVEVLTNLVEQYENEHDPVEAKVEPVVALREMLAQHRMKQKDLAAALGISASAVSLILQGNRPITATVARKLAGLFHVGAGLFV